MRFVNCDLSEDPTGHAPGVVADDYWADIMTAPKMLPASSSSLWAYARFADDCGEYSPNAIIWYTPSALGNRLWQLYM